MNLLLVGIFCLPHSPAISIPYTYNRLVFNAQHHFHDYSSHLQNSIIYSIYPLHSVMCIYLIPVIRLQSTFGLINIQTLYIKVFVSSVYTFLQLPYRCLFWQFVFLYLPGMSSPHYLRFLECFHITSYTHYFRSYLTAFFHETPLQIALSPLKKLLP